MGRTVDLLDEYGDTGPFLRGHDSGATGRTLLREGGIEVRPSIADVYDWRLVVLPVEPVPALTGPVPGTGTAVFRYDGPPALAGLRRLADEDDPLTSGTVQPQGRTVVPADTPRPAPPGRRTAPGVRLRLLPRHGRRHGRAGSWNRPRWTPRRPSGGTVSGRGYAVVRHRGPEAEAMFSHEPTGQMGLLVVRALDDRLEPVRRGKIGSGLDRMPTGSSGPGPWAAGSWKCGAGARPPCPARPVGEKRPRGPGGYLPLSSARVWATTALA